MTKRYTLGFVVDKNIDKIVLINKRTPNFPDGKLNGCGGEVKDGEEVDDALKRKLENELGVNINDKNIEHIGIIIDNKGCDVNENDTVISIQDEGHDNESENFKVDVFKITCCDFNKIKKIKDDDIKIIKISEALEEENTITHLSQIISTILQGYQES